MTAAIRSEAQHRRSGADTSARERLLAAMPVSERRLQLAGISTAVLEGGEGPPIVLLHGPSGYAAHWLGVIPDLVATHRVVAPDLPGHGASGMPEGALDAAGVLAWLGALIEHTCGRQPVLVGQLVGGAIAARFAIASGDRLSGLVLVDTFGLVPLQPVPEFARALAIFAAEPGERTHRALWHYCAFDFDGLHRRMGERWTAFEAYNIERARMPEVQAAIGALMRDFGMAVIPRDELAKIGVPTSLIWGRHDLATPLAAAEAASASLGWPLQVIDDAADDPPVEQPEALVRALRHTLAGVAGAGE